MTSLSLERHATRAAIRPSISHCHPSLLAFILALLTWLTPCARSQCITRSVLPYPATGSVSLEGGVQGRFWVPGDFYNDQALQMLFADGSGNPFCFRVGSVNLCPNLYRTSDRASVYETVIQELVLQPRNRNPRLLTQWHSIADRLGLASELVGTTDLAFGSLTTPATYQSGTMLANKLGGRTLGKQLAKELKTAGEIIEPIGFALTAVSIQLEAQAAVSDFVATTILWEVLATQDALDRLQSLRNLGLFPGDPAWSAALNDIEASLLAVLRGGQPWAASLLQSLEDSSARLFQSAGSIALDVAEVVVQAFAAAAPLAPVLIVAGLAWEVGWSIRDFHNQLHQAVVFLSVYKALELRMPTVPLIQIRDYALELYSLRMAEALDELAVGIRDFLTFGSDYSAARAGYEADAECAASLKIDRTVPNITLLSPAPGSILGTRPQLSLEVVDDRGLQSVRVLLAGRVVTAVTLEKDLLRWSGTVQLDAAALPEGSVALVVEAVDHQGNRSSRLVRYQVSRQPAITHNIPAQWIAGQPTAVRGLVTVQGQPAAGANVQILIQGSLLAQATTDAQGNYELQLPGLAPSPSYPLRLQATLGAATGGVDLAVSVVHPAEGHDLALELTGSLASRIGPNGNIRFSYLWRNPGERTSGGTIHVRLLDPSGTPRTTGLPAPFSIGTLPSGSTSAVQSMTLPVGSQAGTWTAILTLVTDPGDVNLSNNEVRIAVPVGLREDITGYRVVPRWLTNFTNTITYSAGGNRYDVRFNGLNSSSGRLTIAEIRRNGTVMQNTFSMTPGTFRTFDNDQFALRYANFFNVGQFQSELYFGSADNFLVATPGRQSVDRGERATFLISANGQVNITDVQAIPEYRDGSRMDAIESDRDSGRDRLYHIDTSSLEPGTYRWFVQAEDSAQPEDSRYAIQRLELEVLAPQDVSVESDGPTLVTAGSVARFSVRGTARNGYTESTWLTAEIRQGDVVIHRFPPVEKTFSNSAILAELDWTTTGWTPGEYTFVATATSASDANPANNSVRRLFTLEGVPPIVLTPTLVPSTIPEGFQLPIAATVSANGAPVRDAEVTASILREGNEVTRIPLLPSQDPGHFLSPFQPMDPGTYTITLTARSGGSIAGPSSPMVVLVTNAPPTTRFAAVSPADNSAHATRNLTFAWSAEDARLDPDSIAYAYRLDEGEWSAFVIGLRSRVLLELPEGPHRFAVRSSDGLLTETTPVVRTFLIDRTPPVVRQDSPPLDLFQVESERILIAGDATDGSHGAGVVDIRVSGNWPNLATLPAFRFDVPLESGTNRFELTATDGAGNRTARAVTVHRITPEASTTRGLIAHYSFDGFTTDTTTNQLHAEATGVEWRTDRTGRTNAALGIRGALSRVSIPDPQGQLNFDARSEDFTIATWVRFDSLLPNQDQALFIDRAGGTPYGCYLGYSGANRKFFAQSWGGNRSIPPVGVLSATGPRMGVWYHLAFRVQNGTHQLFVNGIEEGIPYASGNILAPGAAGTTNTDQRVQVGHYSDGSFGNPMFGVLDELRIYNRALNGDELVELAERPREISRGLIAWLPLEGSAFDGSPANHQPAPVGFSISSPFSDFFAYTNGRWGQCGIFRTNQFLRMPDSPVFSNLTQLTLSAWIRYDSNAPMNPRIIHKTAVDDATFQLLLKGTGSERPLWFFWLRPDDHGLTSNIPVLAGEWTHVAMTFDGTQDQLFIQGRPVASRSRSTPVPNSTGELTIGGRGDVPSDGYFVGNIDEVRLYSRALLPGEIEDLANPANRITHTVSGDPADPVLDLQLRGEARTRFQLESAVDPLGIWSPMPDQVRSTDVSGSARFRVPILERPMELFRLRALR